MGVFVFRPEGKYEDGLIFIKAENEKAAKEKLLEYKGRLDGNYSIEGNIKLLSGEWIGDLENLRKYIEKYDSDVVDISWQG